MQVPDDHTYIKEVWVKPRRKQVTLTFLSHTPFYNTRDCYPLFSINIRRDSCLHDERYPDTFGSRFPGWVLRRTRRLWDVERDARTQALFYQILPFPCRAQSNLRHPSKKVAGPQC